MDISILYISSAPSNKEFAKVRRNKYEGISDATYGLPESSQRFHTLLRGGLANKTDVKILSLIGRPISFRLHKGIYWPKAIEKPTSNLTLYHLGLINLPVIKQVAATFTFMGLAIKWKWQTRNSKTRVVLVDASYLSALVGLLFIFPFSNSRTVFAGIFCDLYAYMGQVQDARGRTGILMRILRSIARIIYGRLDFFVVLTPAMNARVNLKQKKYFVLEGMVDVGTESGSIDSSTNHDFKTFLYAGALRSEYGTLNLLEAFSQLNDPQARLRIFGDGPAVKDVMDACQKDNRIYFGGIIPHDEVLIEESRASFLVNTRPPELEFTKYSFPSKMMEYLASGTPLLSTVLPGIPEEYFPHFLPIKDGGVLEIRQAMEAALKLDSVQLRLTGSKTRDWILRSKNNLIQAQKLLREMLPDSG